MQGEGLEAESGCKGVSVEEDKHDIIIYNVVLNIDM
jgi:hypothetical protein